MKRSVFREALPSGAQVELSEVADLTALAYRKRLQGILQGGWRNGLIALGSSEVHDALVSRSATHIWVAPGGGSTREKTRALALRLGIACIESCEESLMSKIFGRDTVATMAFLDSALAFEARLCLERVNAFSEDA